jgi:hypothetical protein
MPSPDVATRYNAIRLLERWIELGTGAVALLWPCATCKVATGRMCDGPGTIPSMSGIPTHPERHARGEMVMLDAMAVRDLWVEQPGPHRRWALQATRDRFFGTHWSSVDLNQARRTGLWLRLEKLGLLEENPDRVLAIASVVSTKGAA